jgi:hypothetical protein
MWLGSGAGKVPLNNTKSGPVRFIGRGTDFGVDRGEGVPLPADRRERLDRICSDGCDFADARSPSITRLQGVDVDSNLAEHRLEFGVEPDRPYFLRTAARSSDLGSPLQRVLA